MVKHDKFSWLECVILSRLIMKLILNTQYWVKISADNILKYFLILPREVDLTLCMKCQVIFSRINKNK